MKRVILSFLVFLPTFMFGQIKDTSAKKQALNDVRQKDEWVDEYTERPFNGEEEKVLITPYISLTEHEEYNEKIKKHIFRKRLKKQ